MFQMRGEWYEQYRFFNEALMEPKASCNKMVIDPYNYTYYKGTYEALFRSVFIHNIGYVVYNSGYFPQIPRVTIPPNGTSNNKERYKGNTALKRVEKYVREGLCPVRLKNVYAK